MSCSGLMGLHEGHSAVEHSPAKCLGSSSCSRRPLLPDVSAGVSCHPGCLCVTPVPLPYPSENMAATGQRGSGLWVLQDPQTALALQHLPDACPLKDKIVTSKIKCHYLGSELGRMIPLLSLHLRSTQPSPWLLFALLQPGLWGLAGFLRRCLRQTDVASLAPVPGGILLPLRQR